MEGNPVDPIEREMRNGGMFGPERLIVFMDSRNQSNVQNQHQKSPKPANMSDEVPEPATSIDCVVPAYNWQATMKNVRERFGYLFNKDVLADVYFIVGKGENKQRIPAHKLVMSVGSVVFDALFNGPLATKSDEVEIPDVEIPAFLSLLKFLYTDFIDIDSDTVTSTLYAAKKYAVPGLETRCVDFLEENLRTDNAFLILSQARFFDEELLTTMCLDRIDRNADEAFAAEGFTDINLDCLCLVLERDSLVICEVKLFKAVERWSVAECHRQNLPPVPENQRKVLGRALRLIRFPLMTMEEFALGPVQSKILDDSEAVQIFLYFSVHTKPIDFSDKPRCGVKGNQLVASRFSNVESRWGYSGTSDRVRFTVDRRIFIVGFGLFGSTQSPAEYEVLIQIIQQATGQLCGSTSTSFTSDGHVYKYRVLFNEPVEIMPNTSYVASATLKGPDTYYGTRGQKKVQVDVLGGKVTFQFAYAAGNNNGTSVEDGQIPELIFRL